MNKKIYDGVEMNMKIYDGVEMNMKIYDGVEMNKKKYGKIIITHFFENLNLEIKVNFIC